MSKVGVISKKLLSIERRENFLFSLNKFSSRSRGYAKKICDEWRKICRRFGWHEFFRGRLKYSYNARSLHKV